MELITPVARGFEIRTCLVGDQVSMPTQAGVWGSRGARIALERVVGGELLGVSGSAADCGGMVERNL